MHMPAKTTWRQNCNLQLKIMSCESECLYVCLSLCHAINAFTYEVTLSLCVKLRHDTRRDAILKCVQKLTDTHTHTHTHTRLKALFPGLSRWASTRKVEPIWILLKQETVSGSGISCARCKSAPCSRQITTPAPHHSVFTGQLPFLPPNQQRQSTEGTKLI